MSFKGRIVKNTIVSDKLTKGKKIRLLVIADLHNYIDNYELKEHLITEIKSHKADIILIAGDIFNYGKYWLGGRKLATFKEFIDELANDTYVCVTLGNHDLMGINDDNKELFLNNFYSLNKQNVFLLYNDQAVINDIEIISYVPRNELVQKEGLKKQLHGLAHDEFVADYQKNGVKFKTDNIKIFLGHDPHLIAASENGVGLGDLSKCDYFITGHLHDGYRCYFKFFESLSMNASKGLKSFMHDNGWVEQPLWILDKDGHKVWHLWPPVIGKTNLCRGIVYFDDDVNQKIWQSPDNIFFQNTSTKINYPIWERIDSHEAGELILKDKLHAMLISEGINPGFLASEKKATINIIDLVSNCK